MIFSQWLTLRLNGRKWAVAKVRRGRVMDKYELVLLPREFEALKQEFAAL